MATRREGLKKLSVEASQVASRLARGEEKAGQEIVVHGTVGRIANGMLGARFITLDERPFQTHVVAMFQTDSGTPLAMLAPGAKVYVRGRVSGKGFLSVVLDNCALVE